MSDIKLAHEREAGQLALELYNINLRRDEIMSRLSQLGVILQTVDFCENEAKQELQAFAVQAEKEKEYAIKAAMSEENPKREPDLDPQE